MINRGDYKEIKLSLAELEAQLLGTNNLEELDYIHFICRYKPSQKETFKKFVKENVPSKLLASKDFFFKCFFENHRVIYCIDDSLNNQEFYKEVIVNARGAALEYIPEEFKTKELCDLAIANPPVAYMDIPKKHLTQEICFNFFKTGTPLKRIPEHFRTYEMCLMEAKNPNFDMRLSIPEKFRTEEVCLAHLEANPNQLWNIPQNLRTPEVCLFALENEVAKSTNENFKNYIEVTCCANPDHETTLSNLKVLVNQKLIKKTIRQLSEGECS